jgi:signal transduction histidine kinase
MIHDLLDISRLEAHALELKAQPVELPVLLEAVQRALSPQAHTRGIHLSIRAPERLPASLDRGLLTRALENLASNALRYTPRGARIELSAREEGGALVLTVNNDGEPIAEHLRARIFEKFEQGEGDQRRAGWGLGLYFCGLVAGAHGGSIAVESLPGWATSFVMRLPAAPTQLRAAA